MLYYPPDFVFSVFPMYAVVRSGNKQYPVRVGTVLKVDRLTCEVGSSIVLNDVLFAADASGVVVNGVKVSALVLSHEKDDKVLIFKKKRRKNHRRKRGFRHSVTLLRVQDIANS